MMYNRDPATLILAKDFDKEFLERMRALGRKADAGDTIQLSGLSIDDLKKALWSNRFLP